MHTVKLRSIVIVVMVLVLALGMSAGLVGAEEEQSENGTETRNETRNGEVGTAESQSADHSSVKIDYTAMTDMQIALMMIDNQIKYLMEQLSEREDLTTQLRADYEEQLQKMQERHTNQVKTYEDRVSQLEEKNQEKEEELKEIQASMHQLEKETAIFISESGLYLKILLGFLAGTISGIILGSILHWWKRRGQRPSVEG